MQLTGPSSSSRQFLLRGPGVFRLARALCICLLLQMLCAKELSPPPPRFHTARQRQQSAQECDNTQWQSLYAQIDRDLEPWARKGSDSSRPWGISQELMDEAIRGQTNSSALMQVAILFERGRPYILSNITLNKKGGHHVGLRAAYAMVMVHLAKVFGPESIPDVEFVIGTSDSPSVTMEPGRLPPPIFRFCKTDIHAEILVPYIHFYTRAYDSRLLDKAPAFNAKRREVVFGRFSTYNRFWFHKNNATYKRGYKGADICRHRRSENVTACEVRKHFLEWARQEPNRLLFNTGGVRVEMQDHPQFKWLLHLDGQTCSSRLEQLLALGSLVVREASGYRSFYHHLLQPGVHYVPFWKEVPEEILDVVQWARSHDGEAQKIAAAGQEFALTYLNKRARACYWLKLLQKFSKLLRYKPGTAGGRVYAHKYDAEEFLASGDGVQMVSKFKLQVEDVVFETGSKCCHEWIDGCL